jgi:ligand-binding sensor domain-containing protein
MRRIVSIVFVIVICNGTFAQRAKQYSFRHFTVMNGLASDLISDVVQDAEGYMWLSGVNGLQRFDGNSFITFRYEQKKRGSLPNMGVHSMFVDRKGRLWLSFDHNEVGVFDTKTFMYHRTPLPKDSSIIFPGQLFYETLKGELLLIKNGRSILKYEEAKQQFVSADHLFPLPENWHPNKICWDEPRRRYWFSCDSGMVQFNPANGHVNYRGHNIDKDSVIAAFAPFTGTVYVQNDIDGNVFFFYWKVNEPFAVITRYVRSKGIVENSNLNAALGVYHEIQTYLVQRSGRTWFYGMPFFAEWDRGTNSFIPLNNQGDAAGGVSFDHVMKAYEDRERNIWMATDNGVYTFNPEKQVFNTYDLIRPGDKKVSFADVNGVAEIGNNLLIGCWGAGLFYYDKNLNPIKLPQGLSKKYMSIWDMNVHSRTKLLWICEQAGVLDVYDTKADRLKSIAPAVFQRSTIRQVDEDTSGNLWFGTQNGRLIKWDYKKSGGNPEKGYELVYQTGRILKVHYDYQGFIWVGTLGRGLLKLDARTNQLVKVFSKDGQEGERIFNDSPGDLTYYNDSTLLVTAGCLNVINTKTNKVTLLSTEDGLPANTCESIQRDKLGTIWIGMTNGLCRLNLEKKIISYYDKRDGLNYDRFATTGIDHLSTGEIILFTDHNFMIFDPKKFGQQQLPPRPYITSFRLSEDLLSTDSLRKEKRVVLPYNSTSVTVGFSALRYFHQQKIHYFYMLDGLDKDWIHVDRPMQAIYNSIPPGDYTFKVRSENADGLISEDMASIDIIVRPPFWKTWWFLSLVGLLFILILFLIDKERVKRRESLAMIRRQIRANLKDEVSITLNNINVLSEIAKIKADRNLVQAKEFIDQISEKSRYMDEVLEDTLWSIDPANDSMKKFILRIRELTEAIKTIHEVEVDLIVDNKVQSMELDMKLRYELLFFYKEAMSFIMRNSSCDQLFVNINKTKSKFYIEILSECGSDNPNFETEFESAVAKRVNALPATLDVLSDAKSFSTILYVNVR